MSAWNSYNVWYQNAKLTAPLDSSLTMCTCQQSTLEVVSAPDWSASMINNAHAARHFPVCAHDIVGEDCQS